MATALVSNCDLGGMYSYSRRQTSSLALPHQPSQSPRHNQYEISGLTRLVLSKLCKSPHDASV